ncbi:MAG: ABC transporter ATP-binding protein/permease [Sandaracinaceae bacterium]|nr:ABC transporter ATP-binding protein/permease [Sandaracinaceae bacterium]
MSDKPAAKAGADDEDETPSVRQSVRDSLAALRLVLETHRGYAAGAGLLGLVAAALPAAIAWTGRAIVDAVERAAESGDPSLRTHALWLVAIELGLVVAMTTSQRAAGLLGSLLRMRLAQRVNEAILEKALTLELADFETPELLDRMTRARREASYRPMAHVDNLSSLAQGVLSLVGLGALLATLSGWTVAALVLSTLPSFWAELRFGKEAFRLFSWHSPETRKQNYLEMLLARADYAKEVKLFGLGPLFLERYRAIFHALWADDRDLTVRRAGYALLLGYLSTLVFYVVYGWVAWSAASGALTIGAMTMALLAFRQAEGALAGVLGTVSGLMGDRPYLRTLFSFLEHESAGAPRGTATEGPLPGDGVRFEDVSFTYPGAAEPVLRELTFHLPPRHKLALVGENGAGKTTLIKLLTRLYRPTSGRILLDGLCLEAWDETALHRRIGVIFQDFVQYQLTVGENVGAGDVLAFEDEARWTEAAEKGTALDFVRAFPNGFRTQLGKWFEDGRELSLGQWQKIALSRAFMRKDADILVLDEPTASMDAEAEARIFARFRALTAERTAILISHRFSTVRMADTILVIEHGRILEQGSHAELLAKGGRYAHLFTLQAQGYRD